MIAFKPEAHTLFTVVHMTEWGRPAPRAACRAGACVEMTDSGFYDQRHTWICTYSSYKLALPGKKEDLHLS